MSMPRELSVAEQMAEESSTMARVNTLIGQSNTMTESLESLLGNIAKYQAVNLDATRTVRATKQLDRLINKAQKIGNDANEIRRGIRESREGPNDALRLEYLVQMAENLADEINLLEVIAYK